MGPFYRNETNDDALSLRLSTVKWLHFTVPVEFDAILRILAHGKIRLKP